MKIAVFAGSFDPFTNGHLDIVKQALHIFDKIVIACGDNPEKNYILPAAVRINLIQQCLQQEHSILQEKVIVEAFPRQLLVTYCQQHGYQFVIRGIRNIADFEYEKEMLNINRDLYDKIQYVYFLPNLAFTYVSSSLVKGLLNTGDNHNLLEKYLPLTIANYLTQQAAML